MSLTQSPGWNFIDDQGTFRIKDPQQSNYIYFPLVNTAGMMSSITPTLNGDAKLNQNTFLLLPVSAEDLHNSRSARNFWVKVNGEPWSVTGNSAAQISQNSSPQAEGVTLTAGFLWQKVERHHTRSGLSASVINFVPSTEDTVELMQVTLSNQGSEPIQLIPTAAIPIFGRSADNLRDHRHVTALLNRTQCNKFGVVVKPTMSFDERGHTKNNIAYAVLGVDGNGNPPIGFSPLIEDFIGEGGNLVWPEAIIKGSPDLQSAPTIIEGYESIGGLHFQQICLQPSESISYNLILSIITDNRTPDVLIDRYGSDEKFLTHLKETRRFWQDKLSTLKCFHQHERFDGWLQWVALQPILRRIMGNSFLPYHDYGRGGRGWRDLWQDLMAPLLTDALATGPILVNNFAGVRLDGSHATIVGAKPGEFFADRNSIPRVWMDHGAWPLLTIMLYLDMTGHLDLLLNQQTYFKDHLSHRCQKIDEHWKPELGTVMRTEKGEIVYGTIFEHLLVQHLTTFFNVGDHNFIRLEGGDWNDGLDMASENGESVAFSALYAGNLMTLSKLCDSLLASGVKEIEIAEELLPLLDRLSEKVDYQSIEDKRLRLIKYMESIETNLSGKKVSVPLINLSQDLCEKADWLSEHLRKEEWVTDSDDLGWFNGYYDNLGNKVEGGKQNNVRMTLTGQVFTLMTGIATKSQSEQIVLAADRYLFDESLHGYRLNTNFKDDVPALGRAFGFAYGHKENGSVFSHMNVMFAYALYQQGLAQEAWNILEGLFTQSQNYFTSRIYPGLPEYFDPRGRGMYPYLTGSAAWYLFTILTESFGIKGHLGNLILAPKLVAAQFSQSDQIKVKTRFANKDIDVVYQNSQHLTYGKYCLKAITINGIKKSLDSKTDSIRFERSEVLTWTNPIKIIIELA